MDLNPDPLDPDSLAARVLRLALDAHFPVQCLERVAVPRQADVPAHKLQRGTIVRWGRHQVVVRRADIHPVAARFESHLGVPVVPRAKDHVHKVRLFAVLELHRGRDIIGGVAGAGSYGEYPGEDAVFVINVGDGVVRGGDVVVEGGVPVRPRSVGDGLLLDAKAFVSGSCKDGFTESVYASHAVRTAKTCLGGRLLGHDCEMLVRV
jgi:hypothetical protein